MSMKPVRECILITENQFIGMFSGSDVWIVPIEWYPSNPNDELSISRVKVFWDKAYVGKNWKLQNGNCYDADGNHCAIAVEPEQFQWHTAPEYAEEREGHIWNAIALEIENDG